MDKITGCPLVLIEWQDIVGIERPWLDTEEVLELQPSSMVSVGVIVNQNENFVTLAGTWESGDERQFGNVTCIPRGVIQSLTELGVSQGD
tara:strand:- start:39 stop:308 length:270 start_codon:yes stop_codon:yes gene_type:complete